LCTYFHTSPLVNLHARWPWWFCWKRWILVWHRTPRRIDERLRLGHTRLSYTCHSEGLMGVPVEGSIPSESWPVWRPAGYLPLIPGLADVGEPGLQSLDAGGQLHPLHPEHRPGRQVDHHERARPPTARAVQALRHRRRGLGRPLPVHRRQRAHQQCLTPPCSLLLSSQPRRASRSRNN
jgi:hypothetical protein